MDDLDEFELMLIDSMDDRGGLGFKDLAAITMVYDVNMIRMAIRRLIRKGYVRNKKNDKSFIGSCEKYGTPGQYVLNNIDKVWRCKERIRDIGEI